MGVYGGGGGGGGQVEDFFCPHMLTMTHSFYLLHIIYYSCKIGGLTQLNMTDLGAHFGLS